MCTQAAIAASLLRNMDKTTVENNKKKKEQTTKDPFDEIMEILDKYEEGYVPRDLSDYEM